MQIIYVLLQQLRYYLSYSSQQPTYSIFYCGQILLFYSLSTISPLSPLHYAFAAVVVIINIQLYISYSFSIAFYFTLYRSCLYKLHFTSSTLYYYLSYLLSIYLSIVTLQYNSIDKKSFVASSNLQLSNFSTYPPLAYVTILNIQNLY